jgi:hypothetical protein
MHSPPDQASVPAPSLRVLIDRIRSEVGTVDAELIKQIVADTGSLERQNARNRFEGRIEFARQMHDQRQATQKYLVEYGLQTLKWTFLLNAGALAAVAAFVSGGVGKFGVGAIAAFVPILKSVWPFAVGCVAVALAGACGFFNFSKVELCIPSSHTLHNFLDPTSTKWPLARGQKVGETPEEFARRIGPWVQGFRRTAIVLCGLSWVFFLYGAYRVLQAI